MRPSLAQKYTASCGLACLAYLINSSEEHLLEENSDILSIEKLNFIGLFGCELVELLFRNNRDYISEKFVKENHVPHIRKVGTIIFISPNKQYPIGHYLIFSDKGWMNPWNFRMGGIPQACFEENIPGSVEWILFDKE